MVSFNPTPPSKNCQTVMDSVKIGSFSVLDSQDDVFTAVNSTGADNSYGSEDPNSKKIRKPYTITKSRETWTDQEHDKFIEALHLYDYFCLYELL